MKKLLLSLGIVALAMTSCGNKQTAANFDAEDTAMGDTLSITFGEMSAARAFQEFEQQLNALPEDQKAQMTKAAFLRGVKAVATRDTADMAYIMGIQYGMQLWSAAKGIPAQLSVPSNVDAMMKAFETVFNSDSITDAYAFQSAFQAAMAKAQEHAESKEIARLENSPEAIANKEAGKAYADSLVANAGYTRSESGLVYKIIEPGTGEKAQANSRVSLRYEGKHINGETFDATRESAMTAYPSRFVPGFGEGLQLLAKGGKAIIVIPGDLAYGVRGQGDVIAPNETLVFEIAVEDVAAE